MFNKITLIGRLGQHAEAKTAQNNREYVVLSIATQESWKNDKGEYETRTEWHRVYAWSNLNKVLAARIQDDSSRSTSDRRCVEAFSAVACVTANVPNFQENGTRYLKSTRRNT